jgi:hypothetical protein
MHIKEINHQCATACVQSNPYILLEQFNYKAVHDIMVKINHIWYCKDGTVRVPTEDEIKETATDLMKSLVESDQPNGESSCGGLMVCKFTWKHMQYTRYSLVYCPVETSNY